MPIPSEENHSFVQKQTDAMFLRGNYFKTSDENIKAISIRLYKEAVKGIGVQIECHRMSAFSINIMEKENHENSIQTRFDNYKYLYYHIKESCELQFVCKNLDEVTTAPLYFLFTFLIGQLFKENWLTSIFMHLFYGLFRQKMF